MLSASRNPAHASPLARVNAELARFLRVPPAPLALGADHALADTLIVCGILGGKDVGKSTLINALAEQCITTDREEIGRGTDRPLAFVHRDRIDDLRARLAPAGPASVEIAPHAVDAIRDLALVDLPDFDSDFTEHLDLVRLVAPLLDRIIWVQSPRKIGDRQWVSMFRETVKDSPNILHVLNKVDELLADAPRAARGESSSAHVTARRFWQSQRDWFFETLANLGESAPFDRLFLVSALCPDSQGFIGRVAQRWGDPAWKSFEADRPLVQCVAEQVADDLLRLRKTVLTPLDQETAHRIKEGNRAREFLAWRERLRRYFDVDDVAARLQAADEDAYWESAVMQAVDDDLQDVLANRAASLLRRDVDLADEYLEHRVDRWPLLRWVYWPLGWLSRSVGRQLVPAPPRSGAPRRHETPATEDIIRPRAELLRGQILADHATVSERFSLEAELPPARTLSDQLLHAVDARAAELERDLMSELIGNPRRGHWLGRFGLWLILLWFPFLQPIGAGLLEIAAEGGAWHTARGAYRVVSALSAAHLLAGFGVVLGVYVAILSAMHARGLRKVRAAMGSLGGGKLTERAVELAIAEAWVAPLRRPFSQLRQRLSDLQSALSLGHDGPS